jgi:hypothetical protein
VDPDLRSLLDHCDLVADLVAELGPVPPGTESDPLASLLPRVTDLARRTVVLVAAASVTLVQARQAWTVAPTGPLATRLDEQQYRLSSGPSTDAARTGRQVLVDHRRDRTYPAFSAVVGSAGVSHTLSIGLSLPGQPASLNLYLCARGEISAGVLDRADQLAGYAAVVVGEATGQRAATVHVEQLRSALRTQTVVEAALGIVMRGRHLDPDAALRLLVTDAGRQAVPLRVLAQRVVDRVLTY